MAMTLIYLGVWAGISATLLFVTFILYSAIVHFDINKDKLYEKSLFVRWTCYAILFIGLVFDSLLNWLFLTITYCELPKEFLSTSRIRRHKFNSGGFRYIQSLWWCENWLTPLYPKHCEK